jgi:NitT/TauT family transport system permease protein
VLLEGLEDPDVSGTLEAEEASPATAAPAAQPRAVAPVVPSREWLPALPVRFTLPVAAAIALGLHLYVTRTGSAVGTRIYTQLLGGVFGFSVVAAILVSFWAGMRRWLARMGPILAAALLFASLWELATTGMKWLPLPYFPSPAGVLQSFVDDGALLFDSTWHSLFLLLSGYALGVAVGLVTGVCIGWSVRVRYWGMPVLKVVGPIPATAWIPLAMVLSPDAMFSAMGLIAIAVWFPVSMLTASGIANTRASFLDVARTLGAGRFYLIFRVAIPAAMPNIFIGLFMGLGASFLTLVVAETVGVKSGLGWYVSWAQGWAEYSKVYAALFVMAGFFSTIMSLLFFVRDKVLVWQKGMIRW